MEIISTQWKYYQIHLKKLKSLLIQDLILGLLI